VQRDPDESTRTHTVLVIDDTPDVIRAVHLTLPGSTSESSLPRRLEGLEMAVASYPTWSSQT